MSSILCTVRDAAALPAPPRTTTRRTGNYNPTSWSHEFIESLASSNNTEKEQKLVEKKIDKLRKEIADLFVCPSAASAPVAFLELVDVVGQLGLAYLFEKEINVAIDRLSTNSSDLLVQLQGDLHATSLLFRLLRDNGRQVSQDVFREFLDADGKFKPCLRHQPTALLSLYNASYYGLDGEDTLDEARAFASAALRAFLLLDQQPRPDQSEPAPLEKRKIEYCLELPLRWRNLRLHTLWFIHIYSEEPGRHSALLDLAKFSFNRLQILHRNDLVELSRWWRKLALAEKVPFIRDRIVEIFLFALCMLPGPQFCYLRVRIAKLFCMITVIDDLYDVYGTLDELKLFTESVERWDANKTAELPEYLKICFFALFNDVNEMVYETLTGKKMYIMPYLQKMWLGLCKHYAVEAGWSSVGYTPTLAEYLKNACTSIGIPIIFPYIVAAVSEESMLHEAMEFFCDYPDFVHWNALISRLADDLGTAGHEKEKGDVAKAVECYMVHEKVSEEDAHLHIHGLIREAWKKINKEQYNNTRFPRLLLESCMNLTKVVQWVYARGDGFGFPEKYHKDHVMSLLVYNIS